MQTKAVETLKTTAILTLKTTTILIVYLHLDNITVYDKYKGQVG